MQNRSQDLWPEDIGTPIDIPTPVSILKEQAALLGEKTHNIVEAEIKTSLVDFARLLQHSFYLVAPALDQYRYLLFRATHHGTQFYPVEIASESTKEPITVNSEDELKEALKNLFASEQTKSKIQSLIAQSR